MSTSGNRGQHLIGKEIGGCKLEQLIGYGGSSAVFLAQPRDAQQKVAVKVFLPHSAMDLVTQKSFYRRFLREAQAASELEHPNILSIYSYGEHQGMPYIIMPYISGGTLSEYVKKQGPLTLRDALRYVTQIADALDYAHGQGCIHCDVKPANILLDQDGRVYLSDFGIVRFMQGAVLNAQHSLKSTELLMGTPEYASPEQALGEEMDGRTDVYSLAVSLFFLLTGFAPFRSNSPIKVLLMHVHDKPPRLSSLRGDVTPRVEEIIEKALSKLAAERYQTPGDFSRALSEAISAAAQARNIDRVILKPSALKTLTENRKELEQSLQPVVEVKPLARQPFRLTRVVAIALALGIVLLGSITIGGLYAANDGHSARPQVTPTATILDDLAGQTGSWPVVTASNSNFKFYFSHQKYYIMDESEQYTAVALFENHFYTNFRLTVTCSQIKPSNDGINNYGVVFRATRDESHYYVFYISSGGGGQYSIYRYDNGIISAHLPSGQASSIHGQPGRENTITVDARGNTFTFFVNGKQVGDPVKDTSATALTTGEIGLSVEDPQEEVAFSNLYITNI